MRPSSHDPSSRAQSPVEVVGVDSFVGIACLAEDLAGSSRLEEGRSFPAVGHNCSHLGQYWALVVYVVRNKSVLGCTTEHCG
jgi:hypothetical protein